MTSTPGGLHLPSSRYVLPVIEERTSYGFKRLDPYTKLFEERIIFLGQAIDDTIANDVMAQLLTLESMDPDRDISIGCCTLRRRAPESACTWCFVCRPSKTRRRRAVC
jgi:hypothetical protein